MLYFYCHVLQLFPVREWLWQRPYTTLELQHRPGASLQPLPEDEEGADDSEGVEAVELGKRRGRPTY